MDGGWEVIEMHCERDRRHVFAADIGVLIGGPLLVRRITSAVTKDSYLLCGVRPPLRLRSYSPAKI